MNPPTSWRSPKVVRRAGGLDGGVGLFAREPISAGELIAIKSGAIVDKTFIKNHMQVVGGSEMQLTDDLFLACTTDAEFQTTLIGFNHSCEPNAYIDGQVLLRTMRDITAGEEITVDYATYLITDTMEFDCLCCAPGCRKHVTTLTDWQNPALQAKYKGYFTDFVQAKIDRQYRP